MDLKDFPRPHSDTGIGVQWSPGYPMAAGAVAIETRWIPLLHALGIAWVSFRHEGGLDFARRLLESAIMPIVQIGRPRALPGRLSAETLKALQAYAAIGVRYFELGNPLDDPETWRGGRLPADILASYQPHLLADVEAILQMGGLPGLPACRDAGLVGALVQAIGDAGHQDWLAGGVWLAHRIQAGNLPLDFPNDLVTLQGKPLAEDEYRRRSAETWDGTAWGGRTRDEINADRLSRRDSHAQLAQTPLGWRRHELLDNEARRRLGRSLPILATAGGCAIGEMTDARYPAVSPFTHGARILEMARVMMGASKLYPAAPGQFFCAAFSLLGNYALGCFEPREERNAWFSPRQPGGQLPVIEMLRDEPKRQRWGDRDAPLRMAAVGALDGGASLSNIFAALTEAGQPAARPSAPPWPPAAIIGRLARGAGQTMLLDATDGSFHAAQAAGPDGVFAFRGLSAGVYRLGVAGAALTVEEITLAAGEERSIPLTMPAWHWRISSAPSAHPFSILRCTVQGQPDTLFTLRGVGTRKAGGYPAVAHRGQETWCEFAPLLAGHYTLEPAGMELAVPVELDSGSIWTVEIAPTQAPAERAPALPPLPTDKGLHRYLFLARPLASREELFALLRFLNVHQPACGFSVAEAQWAREVIIVGAGDLRLSAEQERQLRDSGSRVLRVEERVAETLIELSTVGDPFANYQPTP